MWYIEKIIHIFCNILQKISSQKSFLWESENDHKKTTIFKSITIVSFDCDHTRILFWRTNLEVFFPKNRNQLNLSFK
jgi:hypothetical protein